MIKPSVKYILLSGTIVMVFAIILGAFGAHGLKARLSESDLDVFKTGVLYQFIHGFGLLILGILGQIFPDLHFKRSAIFFGLGILCFSGSLYLLSTQTITGLNGSFLGPITPLGGLFFIVGWSLTALQFLKKNAN